MPLLGGQTLYFDSTGKLTTCAEDCCGGTTGNQCCFGCCGLAPEEVSVQIVGYERFVDGCVGTHPGLLYASNSADVNGTYRLKKYPSLPQGCEFFLFTDIIIGRYHFPPTNPMNCTGPGTSTGGELVRMFLRASVQQNGSTFDALAYIGPPVNDPLAQPFGLIEPVVIPFNNSEEISDGCDQVRTVWNCKTIPPADPLPPRCSGHYPGPVFGWNGRAIITPVNVRTCEPSCPPEDGI